MTIPHPVPSLSSHPLHWRERESFVLLDSEFGDGEHFFATWQAWRDDPQRPRQLHYLALLPQLAALDELQQVSAKAPEWQSLHAELRAAWPPAVPGFHRIFLQDEQLILTLMIGDSAACLRQIVAKVDAFRLHGRSWQTWPAPALNILGRLAAEHASLDISGTEETARKQLQQAGFVFESAADDASQTSALRAHFAPRFSARLTASSTAATVHSDRRAIVIGAGLAGSAACQRLVQRGWSVDLIESHTTPAQQASGNTAGIFMPLLSRDDNPGSRLSRSAYLFALQVWRQLGGIGNTFDGAACGVLQIARDAEHAGGQQQLADYWRYPADYAQWLDQAAASRLAGSPVSGGGWYFPAAGWVRPGSLCQTMLESCGDRLQIHFGQRAAILEREQDSWAVHDQHGAKIASAPVLILANACDALHFPQAADLPLSAIRGQITYLDAKQVPAITPVLCGEAYLTPAYEGICSVGASYDEDEQATLRQDSQDANLARLANILPGWRAGQLPLAGRVGFRCVASDRLPLIGALPDKNGTCAVREAKLKDLPRFAGLYSLLGYASRGLIWAPLAAELLASQLNGEPLPIEADLAAALDPARFLLKQRRRGSTPQR
ncbi:FAD-dependent 5-carboxymethylaminomethyl-2-thiouridine(34) oxidoreductase MnmC [Collimonas silvisoli]|uniref:FAD-dependent 5-carboxymethylaminomethyl-2-thiouridine(34) oxidoreductase MnmC n=1 Tax=Collimonas silvisoli TaxID=2825884 RepID=UPI001B8B4299|nr:FAD-dependent 5-carboxymethylaminomethyl-2-thiouridine(34) oxidoreductase MnmC [Collimonas silvisoli]